jgi:hypothetical protein
MDAANKLVLAILNTESSFTQDIERPVSAVPDTVQFWFSPEGQIRIRTYAIDHDIHAFLLGTETEAAYSPETAISYIKNHYQDVVSKIYVLEFPHLSNINEVRRVLLARELDGIMDFSHTGFAFYNPDKEPYNIKINPPQG